MKIKQEYINTLYYVKEFDLTVALEENPFKYPYYKSLKLDFIFEYPNEKKNDTDKKRKHK